MRGGARRNEAADGGVCFRRRPFLLPGLQRPQVLGGRLVRQGATVARELHAALLGRTIETLPLSNMFLLDFVKFIFIYIL